MTNTIVSTDWLREHLLDSNLRIVDLRGKVLPASEPSPHYFNLYAEYQNSHISGAVFVDWIQEITDPDSPHHSQVAPPERFATLMSKIGIDADTCVVTYDQNNSMFAARLWWMLNYYGHNNVAVLDGGWEKWIAEGHPTTDKIPKIESSEFKAEANPLWIRHADHVQAAIDSEKVILDVRSVGEFKGEASRVSRKGHIPSAVNLPRKSLLQADNTLLPPDALRESFAKIGITAETSEVILHCNGGVSASYGLLALKVAGIESGTLYDGSWKEWGDDPQRPIE